MSIKEKKRMVLLVIRKLKDKLCALRYCDYDGIKSLVERDEEIEALQRHLQGAHSLLVSINEEEENLQEAV